MTLKARFDEPEWRRFLEDDVLSHPSRGRVLDLTRLTRSEARRRLSWQTWLRYRLVDLIMALLPVIGILCLALFVFGILIFVYAVVTALKLLLGAL